MFNRHFVYTGKIDREVEPAKTFIAKIWEIIENSLS